jgi:hypothetical protein
MNCYNCKYELKCTGASCAYDKTLITYEDKWHLIIDNSYIDNLIIDLNENYTIQEIEKINNKLELTKFEITLKNDKTILVYATCRVMTDRVMILIFKDDYISCIALN